jgi:hypothetical protein
VPSQLSIDTCPLLDRLTHGPSSRCDLRCTSGCPGTAEPPLVTQTRLDLRLQASLCHPAEIDYEDAWVRVKSEAPCVRWGIIREALMGLRPTSPIVTPHRRGSTLMNWTCDRCNWSLLESITPTHWGWSFTVFYCEGFWDFGWLWAGGLRHVGAPSILFQWKSVTLTFERM